VKTSDFDYELPESAIAQEPAVPRDAARLLVYDIARDRTEHRTARDLPEILRAGDLLVVNDTRVRPARLFGRRASGGSVELLMLGPVAMGATSTKGATEPAGPTRTEGAPGAPGAACTTGASATPGRWRAFVKPAKRLRSGESVELEGGALVARAVERVADGAEWIVEIQDPRAPSRSVEELLEERGHVPLPPYIHRGFRTDPDDASEARDRERYQTVFAAHPGAVAAPTAGLHFTHELLARLAERGIERASVTLHVGAGTFQPVQVEEVEEHCMHAEEFVLDDAAVAAVERARARGGRVIAVGTTSARVLESCAGEDGRLHASAGSTRLFITPGRRFRAIDGLLTNFHLPRSTLLMLVSAFAGRERVLRLYREALERGYRFYSYGDAMLLLP
jgi:S-adenosylmethionine:tRNA ribosyltransferase-isomerase